MTIRLRLRPQLRRPSHDQFRTEYDVSDIGRAAPDDIDEHLGRAPPHFPMLDANRGKRRRDHVHERHVVVSDDRHVLRTAKAPLLQRVQDA
jgi:hypothetical protein